MLIQGDMPSLLNHNMKSGSRYETNEFSQNVSLIFFFSNFYYDVQNIIYESN